MIFRKFGVNEVPCFVLVEGAMMANDELSIGAPNNLQNEPRIYKSFGDWSLSYHLKVI